jgi:hypothetical protein
MLCDGCDAKFSRTDCDQSSNTFCDEHGLYYECCENNFAEREKNLDIVENTRQWSTPIAAI